MRGWSVGIISDPAYENPPTREDVFHRPELRACKMIYDKGELTVLGGRNRFQYHGRDSGG